MSASAFASPAIRERTPDEISEWHRCAADPVYFIDRYCHIYDGTLRRWIPFHVWRSQVETVDALTLFRLVVILKSRQIGETWVVLAFALWLMIFWPSPAILLFSKDEISAIYLLGAERLRGMYQHLPRFLQVGVVDDAAKTWSLANGSICRAFSTKGGDSYTATFVIVDEADLVPDLGAMMRAAKPTIDGGGSMVLLSRANKADPESEFKKIYRAAKTEQSGWHAMFLPWHARPDRTRAWYEAQKRESLANTGSLDFLFEHYPNTDTEALAPRSLDKRIAPPWLEQCYREQEPLDYEKINDARKPSIPGLQVFVTPQRGRRYVIGGDPAEGNPTSDDSALEVLDAATGEEVARLAGKFQPAVFGAHLDTIGRWYNNADIMVERNNHGHAVLLWLRDNSRLKRLTGHDGNIGWLDNTKGKSLLYDACADAFREKETVLHSFETQVQLQSIEGATLRAPDGQHDDKADAYALAIVGINKRSTGGSAPGVGSGGQAAPGFGVRPGTPPFPAGGQGIGPFGEGFPGMR